MKITKYSQFTYTVENKQGKKLLIDPGKYNYENNFTTKDFGHIDLMIITHKHADHHDINAEGEIVKNSTPIVYTNTEIGEKDFAKERGYRIAKVGDVINELGFKITLTFTDHFAKGEFVINFGMFIECDGKSFYHTSDTRFLEQNMYDYELVKNPNVLTLPISNRGVVMGIEDAIVFTSQIVPEIVIPAHYDSPKDSVRVNPQDFVDRFKVLENRIETLKKVKVQVLNFGESLNP
ncbi:MBL fold metallo-hydrolase [uncultured Dokdonia sp.]|uniref:MBL fold metallo-hydrolase n=1 Tax=uncultured Dokdonia sp. TaxID=575653 RepID=UPI0026076171|nr:MBL fold metallo-hydrolase [uncultured Dokdonia sp.]